MRDITDRQTPDIIHGGMRIGYARVSTSDQNLDLQKDALEGAGCADIYTDKISGTADALPEQENALRALRKGDTLVVWRLDRLGRSFSKLIKLINDLDKRGICLESLTEAIDTSTTSGRMVAHTFANLADYERNLTLERTMAGIQAARARGRKGGRKPSLDDKAIREIEILLADPIVTVKDVAESYNVSRTTIYRHINVERIKSLQIEAIQKEEAHG